MARMIDEQTGDSCRAQPATKKVVLVLLAQVQNAFWVRDDDSAEWNHEFGGVFLQNTPRPFPADSRTSK